MDDKNTIDFLRELVKDLDRASKHKGIRIAYLKNALKIIEEKATNPLIETIGIVLEEIREIAKETIRE